MNLSQACLRPPRVWLWTSFKVRPRPWCESTWFTRLVTWFVLGKMAGNLTSQGNSDRLWRSPTSRIPSRSTNGSSLGKGLESLSTDFRYMLQSLWLESAFLRFRTLNFSLKEITSLFDCHLPSAILAPTIWCNLPTLSLWHLYTCRKSFPLLCFKLRPCLQAGLSSASRLL